MLSSLLEININSSTEIWNPMEIGIYDPEIGINNPKDPEIGIYDPKVWTHDPKI